MLDPSLRKTVTIDADDAFLPSILTILAESSGYNIVTGPNVNKKERISIHLKDVPIDEAINLVVRAAGLSYEKIGNSFLVAETANLKEEVGLTAHVIELRYLDATEASELLSFFNANIKVDKSGNNLMIITSPKVISEIKQVIKVVDVPSLQIMLEARLVEVAVEDKEEFGINWEQLSSITSILAEQGIVGKMEGEIGSAGSYAGSGYVAVQGREFGEYPDEVPFMKMDSWNDFGQFSRQLQVLNITIDWLLKNNRAEVLANTRLATMNNRTAHLEVVDVFPYIMQTGGIGGTVTVQREEVGVKLDITPNVNSDGQITTTITPEVSSIFQLVGPPNQQVPWVVRRKSTTTIRVKDGESILIAGLLGVTASNTQHKVPFLGDIPYIGSLFRHTDNTVKKTDLIIQITPHILTDDFSGWSKPETIKASEERYLKELDEWQP
ncbi:secretin and TonB N-terminal domain-containing protein [bacterium]|nr:secretin and TonB N-terminal domain-containing protein [bacterium]